MHQFLKTVLTLLLTLLAGAISLTLITAAIVVINQLRDHQAVVLPTLW